jgi:hypothetical protein
LLASEPVSGTIEVVGSRKRIEAKFNELLDKGGMVEFKPGEVRITGSPLFEHFEKTGGAMQSALESPANVTLVCRDKDARELGRIADVPGRLKGGRKELWFDGGLGSSPLSVKLGPIGEDVEGSVKLNWKLTNWDGQHLLHLAFFDKLFEFSKALAKSATIDVLCQVHGNPFFSVNLGLATVDYSKSFSEYMTLIDKARKIAFHFGINPSWTFKAFDADAQETARDLYAIFFGGGLVESMPNVSVRMTCQRSTFKFGVFAQVKGLVTVAIASDWGCTLLGDKIGLGKLTQEYTAVKIAEKKPKKKKGGNQRPKGDVVLMVIGSRDTVRTTRPGELPSDSAFGLRVAPGER